MDFDVIVMPGDLIDVGWMPRGFSETDMAELILEELNSLGKPVVTVPGNQDKDVIGQLDEHSMNVHGKGKTIDGVGFYGFGGARTPFGTPFEPPEEEILRGLEQAYSDVAGAKIKVQVTHMPPAGTNADRIQSGAHVGSDVVRRFIEEKRPAAAISAHIHEARCVDELAGTKIINSGRLPESYYGLVDVGNGAVVAKIANLT
jgi:Icc-related predicted phosphoesterase